MAGRLIKLLVSVVVGAWDAVVGLLAGGRAGSCVVINYHSVSEESRAQFGRQLDLLLRLAQPVPAAKAFTLEHGRHYVAITADDLFCSFVEGALPELRQRKIPVTLFVPTGYLGRKSSWDDYGGENKVGELVATAEEVKRMAECATVDFGSHTVNHADLARLPEAEAKREMRDSKESLQALVGREVIALSFPYGSYGARELKLASEAGYQYCFDSTPQAVLAGTNGGLIGRISVQPTDWEIEFRLKILGAYRWVRWASNGKRRLLSLVR